MTMLIGLRQPAFIGIMVLDHDAEGIEHRGAGDRLRAR